MRYAPFGPTGVDVSIIGQGTWNVPESGTALNEAKESLRYGVELGMNHIDTAEMYGGGAVERIVGDAIQGLPRERLFLVSKVLPSNAGYDNVLRACEQSLRRARTPYFDCYLLHWPSNEPLRETMRALETLVERGQARSIGVSNFDVDDMLEAESYLRNVPLACNQVLYHLRERGIEHRLIPEARRRNIAVVAYTPFGRGRIPASAHAALEPIAKKHGTTVHGVMLAFLTRTPGVFTIPKASTRTHVEQNASAAGVRLDDDDVAAIDKAFPVGEERPLATL